MKKVMQRRRLKTDVEGLHNLNWVNVPNDEERQFLDTLASQQLPVDVAQHLLHDVRRRRHGYLSLSAGEIVEEVGQFAWSQDNEDDPLLVIQSDSGVIALTHRSNTDPCGGSQAAASVASASAQKENQIIAPPSATFGRFGCSGLAPRPPGWPCKRGRINDDVVPDEATK